MIQYTFSPQPRIIKNMFSFMKPLRHGKNCPCKLNSSKARTRILLPHLRKILRASHTEKSKQLQKAPACIIIFAADCATALLKNHITLPTEKYKSLKKHRNTLHFLAKKKPSIKQKRDKLIQQNGAGLGIIIPILSAAIQGIVQALT